jgi:hypothetical protein
VGGSQFRPFMQQMFLRWPAVVALRSGPLALHRNRLPGGGALIHIGSHVIVMVYASKYRWSRTFARVDRNVMSGIVYLIGLVVIILFVAGFSGLI